MNEELKLQMNNDVSLREAVFATLRAAILDGTLRPGERLMEIGLARQLGVARTPVREAIRKLEKEGLVRVLPRRGAAVAGIRPEEQRDLLEVRTVLEELALRRACRRINAKQLAKLESASQAFAQHLAAGDLSAAAQADRSFHTIISAAAGNGYLSQLLEDMEDQFLRYRMETIKDKSLHTALIRQHTLIVEALCEGSEEKAVNILLDQPISAITNIS